MASQSANGSSQSPIVVQVLQLTRRQRICQHWDLVEMTDGSHKARCKYYGALLGAASNSTFDKHITKKFCPVLKNSPESDQADMGPGGEIFHYSVDMVQDHSRRQRVPHFHNSSSELSRYSGTDYTSTMLADDIESFDILAWWKGREAEFPVLSTMACDLLTSQASTVASESAFSTCDRVISLRRTRLSPEAVGMCFVSKITWTQWIAYNT
ncbi:hypothetical protein QVD17_39383 [Tagetes erecta]|uniref:HAT C-terminal dimerisation domain-containing protein n=1 Tax=Tagetes erecta TaxID=13708 RepID=A0AAD8JS64_TARER|nr:hypothetical protein QVD17_39383 [Tagetes erecta]